MHFNKWLRSRDPIMDSNDHQRQRFSRANKLVFLLLALLPVWYLLHQQFTFERASAADHEVTLSETTVRILVGVIGFLAFMLLMHGGKRGKRQRPNEADMPWFACPSCGQRVQHRPERGSRITCPACDSEFEPNSVAASPADVDDQQDLNKWVHELREQRQRARQR